MKVKVTTDHLSEVLASIRTLARNEVMIGIPGENSERDDEDQPITNPEIGYIQEFGSPINNIPPRPFLIPGVASISDKVADVLGRGAKSALGGDTDAAERAMLKAGLIGQAAVRHEITTGDFVPLSERTLEARKSRGVTRTSPLIDTGQLRNSITYVVRPKGRK